MGARRTAAVVGGVLAAGAVATAVTVVDLPGAGRTPSAAGGAPAATAEITRQTLVDRESHDGTLAYGETRKVSARLSGTVTGLPAGGATITRGKALFRLDNTPVTLLYGALPAFRELATGVQGADVTQFERNLWALGYRGFTVDRVYSSATAAAVRKWQAALGRPRTGTVDPGQIVYAAGPVRVFSLSLQEGTVVGPGTEVEQITGTSPLVTVSLDAAKGRLARPGAAVVVKLPEGQVVPGTILAVTTIVTPGRNGESATTTFDVTIRFTKAVKTQGTAAVSVAFTVGQRPRVLTVPVAALVALAEGGYGVQVVDGGATRNVAVETGLFADGKVEITGAGVRAGMTVVMPS